MHAQTSSSAETAGRRAFVVECNGKNLARKDAGLRHRPGIGYRRFRFRKWPEMIASPSINTFFAE